MAELTMLADRQWAA